MKDYKDYLFYDDDSGESFIVQADCPAEAKETASEWFAEPKFLGYLSPQEAECLGYDTY